jgi:hypothetical protein
MAGVRTRWETVTIRDRGESEDQWLSKKDQRASIQPNLGNLHIEAWLKSLVDMGANMSELNIDPERQLSESPSLTSEKIDAYWNAILKPIAERTPVDVKAIEVARESFKRRQFTPEQRDELLLRFLGAIEQIRQREAWARRGAGAKIHFLLHQREWFRSSDSPAQRAKRINDFVTSMSGFINKARARCLDHWIAGIRLGEHANKEFQQLLPLLVELARGVNAQTSGWLRGRLFLANGGGHGAEYKGILSVHDPNDSSRPYDFWGEIAKETKGFAFGYKWMMFRSPTPRGPSNITEFMESAVCDPVKRRRCDPGSQSDWEKFLGKELGLQELITFVNSGRDGDYANVIFVGDSSDSIHLLSDARNGALTLKPALLAIESLFQSAAATPTARTRWSGKLFMVYSTNAEGDADPKGDSGFSLFLASPKGNGDRPVPAVESIQQWKSWPRVH